MNPNYASCRSGRRSKSLRLCLETLEERFALATHIWNGAFSNLWSNSSNWIGGSPAGDSQAVLSFPSAAANFASQNDLAGLTVAEIDFAAGNYALSGNTITLVPGPLGFPRLHMDATGKNNSISFPLDRIATNVDISLDIAAGSILTINGVMSGGAAATNIFKSGAGTLVLAGANTFADGVLITGGVLIPQNGQALGTTSTGATNQTTLSGGILELQGGVTVGETLFTGSNGGTLRNVSGDNTWAGKVLLGLTDLTIDIKGSNLLSTLMVSGQISDNSAGAARGFTKLGSGTLILASANTYRGTTAINEGLFRINDVSALGTADGGTRVFGTFELHGSMTVVAEPLNLGGSLISVDGDNVWQGPITLNGRSVIGASTGTLTVSGVIGGTAASVDVGDHFSNTGKVIFTNANTYLAETNLTGILNIRHPLAVGHRSFSNFDVIINSGALELELQGVNSINRRLGVRNFARRNDAIRNVSGINTWSGEVILGGRPTIGVGGGQLTISGAIRQDLFTVGITKVGDGPLFLTSNNIYDGDTVINAGSLFVNGTITGTTGVMSSKVVLNSGTLGGTGTVTAITANGGIVNPGVGVGRLTANGAGTGSGVTFGPAAVFAVSLNGTTAGTSYDQLRVLSSQINLGGATLRASLNFAPPTTGVSFRIIDNATTLPIVGTFAGLPEGATIVTSRGSLRITYRGGDGNDVVLNTINTSSRLPDRSVTPVIDEGGVATLTGTISDPDLHEVFFLDVNWGDGTPTEHHVFPPGSDGKQVQLTHRYRDDDPTNTPQDAYNIQLAWHDKAGEGSSATLTTLVRNVAPVVNAVPEIQLPPSGVLNQRVSFTDPGRDTWTATIDYGDGSAPQLVDVHGNRQFSLHHRYRQNGTFVVKVTVLDDDGGVGTTSFRVRWADRPEPSLVDAFYGWFDENEQENKPRRRGLG